MGKVQSVHNRLAHVGVGVAGQAAEPGLNRVQVLADGDEAAAVDEALDREQLLVGLLGIGIHDHDGRGQITEGDMVGAQLLQRLVGVRRLVVGVGVDERRLAIEHHLAQDGSDRLALGEPLPPQSRQVPGSLGLVERNPACGPAIGEAQVVQRIQQSGRGRVREPQHRQHAQVLVAELGLDAAEQRTVAQNRVEMYGDGRHRHRVPLAGDGAVQVSQRASIIERLGLRQNRLQHLQRTSGLGDEPFELGLWLDLDGRLVAALVEHALGLALALGRRQVEEREVVPALMVRTLGTEGRIALLVDEPGRAVSEARAWILVGWHALSFEE